MSRRDSALSLANSDEPGDLQELNAIRSLVSYCSHRAQVHTHTQLPGHVHITFNERVEVANTIIYKAIQNNSGRASGFQGNNTMSTNGRNREDDESLLSNGDDPEANNKETTPKTPSRESTPEGFLDQPPDWFEPGRFFRMWAREDLEIHKRQFILLDSKNVEGQGVRVDSLDRRGLRQLADKSAAHRTTLALKCCRSPQDHVKPSSGQGVPFASAALPAKQPQLSNHSHTHSKAKENEDLLRRVGQKNLRPLYIEEHQDEDGMDDMYVQMEHTYNIPFKHEYKYKDLGMLEQESLDELRISYCEYLARSWRVTDQVKKRLEPRR